ncbi:MAG: hypothetical protein UX39_C0014G0010 [Candidatus Magasanikbacteria bacterium GW2011_GWA2_46_17]|uniref:Pilus assembly protein, PilO n=1 Tax=Candidatus Magasanikbacteria bacterium GW2011_GWA2_46_17 TaxID=1619042 RepID=A0A0G1P052_9BACT|nr:MAG: hypothetical protein UX39_C0014G0010 [Candidatus Magasanikbacteria bacterium GW2011_GWA2_46_17]
MLSPNEKKVVAFVSILTIITFCIIFFIITPTVKDIYATKKRTQMLKVSLEENYNRAKKLRVSKEQIEGIKSSLPQYLPHIFRKGDELELITFLESVANKNKVSHGIQGSNLDQPTNNRLSISLNITGRYINILRYLADLESADYFINVTRLQLAPLSIRNQDTSGMYSLSLSLGIYVAP